MEGIDSNQTFSLSCSSALLAHVLLTRGHLLDVTVMSVFFLSDLGMKKILC